jgi:hypothetical protein
MLNSRDWQDYIEYVDPVIGVCVIPDFGEVEPDLVQTRYRESVFRAMWVTLETLMRRPELERAPCFSMNGVIFDIERDGMEEIINNSIQFFTEIEEYEKCAKLRDYLKE